RPLLASDLGLVPFGGLFLFDDARRKRDGARCTSTRRALAGRLRRTRGFRHVQARWTVTLIRLFRGEAAPRLAREASDSNCVDWEFPNLFARSALFFATSLERGHFVKRCALNFQVRTLRKAGSRVAGAADSRNFSCPTDATDSSVKRQ